MTLVSILTPSFEQGRFIGDCLESVAQQTHRPLEHIVCDGGSSDGTIEILRRAGEHVHWRSEPDDGQGHALNKAFALSRGDIIGWLNSDDGYVDRRAVERAVRIFEQEPLVDVVYGHALLVNEQNEVLQVLTALPFRSSLYKLVHYVIQPTVFIRRSALEGEPFFVRADLNFVLDRDLFIRLSGRSRFRRATGVTAADRHQRQRKVLVPAFSAEAAAFERALRVPTSPAVTVARRAVLAVARIAGAVTMLRLTRTVDPAFPLRFPAPMDRLRFQLLTPRRKMHF